MSAANVAHALGGRHAGRGWLCSCPVPSHGRGQGDRRPSLLVMDGDKVPVVVKCLAGCDSSAVLAELRNRGLLLGSAPIAGNGPPGPDRKRLALQIWEGSRDPNGTLAEEYLLNRGLTLGNSTGGYWGGIAIRFHPALRYEAATAPAMVALMRDVRTMEPVAIHRTFLDAEGRKLERRMLGPAGGAAVMLDYGVIERKTPPKLMISEGLETALACRLMGGGSTWALGSAGEVARFPVLPGVEQHMILTENDSAGQRAAEACGQRWARAGRRVFFASSPVGVDLADLAREACNAA